MTQKEAAPVASEAAPVDHLISNPSRRRAADSTTIAEVPREWHRRQFLHNLRAHRRISRELDAICGVDRAAGKVEVLQPPDVAGELYDSGGGYGQNGMSLGWPERRTAGVAMTDWYNQDAA